MVDACGYASGILWFVVGLVGSFIFAQKGYTTTIGVYLWGAMLGPIQLLLAILAPPRRY